MQAFDPVKAVVAEHNLVPAAVLVTHGHFDHMWSAAEVADHYDCPLWIHPADRHLLVDPMAAVSGASAEMLRQQFAGIEMPDFAEPGDVRDAVDGAIIELDGLSITVDHVPGHTPGTVMYRIDYPGPEPVSQIAFTGDFLFYGSIGRTDLTGGSYDEMRQSLKKKILTLPDDVVVLPGHGQQTSVGRERATNPFIAELIES